MAKVYNRSHIADLRSNILDFFKCPYFNKIRFWYCMYWPEAKWTLALPGPFSSDIYYLAKGRVLLLRNQ